MLSTSFFLKWIRITHHSEAGPLMGLVVYLEGLMSIFLKTNESAYHCLAGLLRGPVVSRLTWWYLEAVLSVISKSISGWPLIVPSRTCE